MTTEHSGVWAEFPADTVGDALVAAMVMGGVDHLFFTSGTEIGFYQEAIAKARAQGRKAPRLVMVTHEHASLNAALGYAAVSGKPAATAAHVDCGTQHYGGAIHTAWRSGLPILITAGAAPVAYPGSLRGARDGAHLWMQDVFDQNGILRQYTKWDHRLEFQDNPGIVVSRALQVARTAPAGPVYLSLPREITFLPMQGARFPTTEQLGIPRPAFPDPDGIRAIADRLIKAKNPFIVVSSSGRNPATVRPLVDLCELLGVGVVNAAWRGYLSFPMTHPLLQSEGALRDADVVVALDASIPWIPEGDTPPREAYVAVIDLDPIKARIPTYEFTADIRMAADPLLAIEALMAACRDKISAGDKRRFAERAAAWAETTKARWQKLEREVSAKATKSPIDREWLSYQIGQTLDDNCLVLDETTTGNRVYRYLRIDRPGSYLTNPGSCGGWATGAALGAKLAAPDRDVVALTGDGFYQFGVPNAAIWSAAHHKAPFMTVVYVNRSYGTGTVLVDKAFPGGYAAKSGFEGGYFDPPIDFAREAEAAGAYGETVTDPAEIAPALKRGLAEIRHGRPAVIAVRLPRLLRDD